MVVQCPQPRAPHVCLFFLRPFFQLIMQVFLVAIAGSAVSGALTQTPRLHARVDAGRGHAVASPGTGVGRSVPDLDLGADGAGGGSP